MGTFIIIWGIYMEKESPKRSIEVKIRLTEEENEKLEKIANKIKMSKARLIRNIALGDIDDINIIQNIGILPLIQNVKAFYDKTFKGINYWEEIKKD
ncbi:MAG: hypothetical protein QG565_586 [Campylobacterota bacterium]|nr:hypothetical protein [Campylobacterota bacterium]MDQ1338666.1 hypothetical protein [Campylobacterota bacterium]